jgi:glycosyltransferase involved in cell wall biosynthesis
VPESWFQLPFWKPGCVAQLPIPGHVLPATHIEPTPPPEDLSGIRGRLKRARRFYVDRIREHLPAALDRGMTRVARAARAFLRSPFPRKIESPVLAQQLLELPWQAPTFDTLPSGVVYCMVLAPSPRKALEDLITAFVWSLRDRADATLVLRIVSRDQEMPAHLRDIDRIYESLASLAHQCRVVVLTGPMTGEQVHQLARCTTYYVNATRAEGACLPLMEMLAAGRPALSPIHTAMRDYFDGDVGFVVESHPEPCSFPGDSTAQLKTTRHRLVWQSLYDQFQASYALAQDPAAYRALAENARARMQYYAGTERVFALLKNALAGLHARPVAAARAAGGEVAAPARKELPRNSRPPACVYVEATPLFDPEPTGISRYCAGLLHWLRRSTEVRVPAPLTAREPDWEIVLHRDSPLPDVGNFDAWRRAFLQLPRRPRDPSHRERSPVVLTFWEPRDRRFGREVCIVHDLTPLVVQHDLMPRVVQGVPWDALRAAFASYCQEVLPRAEAIVCDSHATRDDLAWLTTGIDPERVTVAYPGLSLCQNGHVSKADVQRDPHVLLMVGAHHPRKNGELLFDWFWHSAALPRGMELWWAGPNVKVGQAALPKTPNRHDRRIRLLGEIPDRELCELYRRARCLVYPSLYEGFGFPVLDALSHGTPVICGRHSSLIEFEGPGVFYCDPRDRQTLDEAFLQLCEAEPMSIDRTDLRRRCSWETLAAEVLRLCA